jgi:hypothetical protein
MPLPAQVYANEGLYRIMYIRFDEPCEVSNAAARARIKTAGGLCCQGFKGCRNQPVWGG